MKRFFDNEVDKLFHTLKDSISLVLKHSGKQRAGLSKRKIDPNFENISSVEFRITDTKNRQIKIVMIQGSESSEEYFMEIYPNSGDPTHVLEFIKAFDTDAPVKESSNEIEDAVVCDKAEDSESDSNPGLVDSYDGIDLSGFSSAFSEQAPDAFDEGIAEKMPPDERKSIKRLLKEYDELPDRFKLMLRHSFEEIVGSHVEYLLHPEKPLYDEKSLSSNYMYVLNYLKTKLKVIGSRETLEDRIKCVVKNTMDLITKHGASDPDYLIPADNFATDSFSDRKLFLATRSIWYEVLSEMLEHLSEEMVKSIADVDETLSISGLEGESDPDPEKIEKLRGIIEENIEQYKKYISLPPDKLKSFKLELSKESMESGLAAYIQELWVAFETKMVKKCGKIDSEGYQTILSAFKHHLWSCFMLISGELEFIEINKGKEVSQLLTCMSEYVGILE